MKRISFGTIAMLALLFASGFAGAHHGTAGSYDHAKVVTLNGIVKEFRWRNPHSALFLVCKDATGSDVTYAIEMGSPNTLARAGMRRDTIKAGDAMTIQVYPSFTNPLNGVGASRSTLVINGKQWLPADGDNGEVP